MSEAGYKSILAPWVGGAQAPAEAPLVGFPSMMAGWVGGAQLSSGLPPPLCGYPSMMAGWVGGARCAGTAAPTAKSPAWRRIAAQRVGRMRDDEDEALTLLLLS